MWREGCIHPWPLFTHSWHRCRCPGANEIVISRQSPNGSPTTACALYYSTWLCCPQSQQKSIQHGPISAWWCPGNILQLTQGHKPCPEGFRRWTLETWFVRSVSNVKLARESKRYSRRLLPPVEAQVAAGLFGMCVQYLFMIYTRAYYCTSVERDFYILRHLHVVWLFQDVLRPLGSW